MKGEFWVSDLLSEEQIPKKLTKDKFNIIESDTGAGKTVWAVQKLSEYQKKRKHNGRILFITDTHSNRKSLLYNEEEFTQEYSKFIRECINKRVVLTWSKEIMIMTYGQLAVLLHFNNEFNFNFLDYVIFDEIHTLMKSKNFVIQDKNGKDVVIQIRKIITEKIIKSIGGNPYIIGMTATPSNIYNSFLNSYVNPVFTPDEIKSLFHYETFNTYRYSEFNSQLELIPVGTKGLIYFDYVSTMERAYEMLKSNGHKVDYIFSLNNKKHAEKLTNDRKNIIDVFVNQQKIREDIDILIINGGYGTGLKFNSYIEFMIIHSYVKDTRKQVRGRFSGDLDKLCYPDKSINDVLIIPREFLYTDLFTEDKKRLSNELDLKNKKNNRQKEWTSISKIIKKQKIYEIVDGKRIGNLRSHRIIEKL